jgi:hypothetical protein
MTAMARTVGELEEKANPDARDPKDKTTAQTFTTRATL